MSLKKLVILHVESHVFGYFDMCCSIIIFLIRFHVLLCQTLMRYVKFLTEALFLKKRISETAEWR